MKQRDHYRQIIGLISRIGRLTNPQHLPLLKQRGISLTQFLVLDALSAAKAPLRMSALSATAGLPPSELTRVVKELERKKWIERTADPDDNRARLVRITRTGARWIEQAHEDATAELREVWSDFTHDEWHRFIDFLQRFEHGLSRARAHKPLNTAKNDKRSKKKKA